MNCPVCQKAMIVLEIEQVEIDYCSGCEGIWLDAGELELLLYDSAKRDAFLASFTHDTNPTERARKCPICSKRMEKISVGRDGHVHIDRCRNNDGIWLDGGELKEILSLQEFGSQGDQEVLNLLRNIFMEKEPEKGG